MALNRASATVIADYEEVTGSPTITADERGVTGVRKFKVRGRSVAAFIKAVRGSPRREDPPEQLPGFPALLCTSATAVPVAGVKADPADVSGGFITTPKLMSSEYWHVDCRYELMTTIKYDFASEALTLPTGNLGWSGDNTPIEGMAIATTVPMIELEITRKAVPILSIAKIMRCLGKVNNSDFNPLTVDQRWRASMGLGQTRDLTARQLGDPIHAAKCLLFLGASASMVLDPFGDVTWDLTFKFAARPEYADWGKFFRPDRASAGTTDAGRWEPLFIKTVGPSGDVTETEFEPYAQTNMDQVFV